MDLKLTRSSFQRAGIFGVLSSVDQSMIVAITLEHAYSSGVIPLTYSPKIPPGTYQCVRGLHRLAHMRTDFETFEITGVAGHSNILFHVGNTNEDSEGCVILGSKLVGDMVTFSQIAFERFMKLQAGIEGFLLAVA